MPRRLFLTLVKFACCLIAERFESGGSSAAAWLALHLFLPDVFG